jgi:hypothetical protein
LKLLALSLKLLAAVLPQMDTTLLTSLKLSARWMLAWTAAASDRNRLIGGVATLACLAVEHDGNDYDSVVHQLVAAATGVLYTTNESPPSGVSTKLIHQLAQLLRSEDCYDLEIASTATCPLVGAADLLIQTDAQPSTTTPIQFICSVWSALPRFVAHPTSLPLAVLCVQLASACVRLARRQRQDPGARHWTDSSKQLFDLAVTLVEQGAVGEEVAALVGLIHVVAMSSWAGDQAAELWRPLRNSVESDRATALQWANGALAVWTNQSVHPLGCLRPIVVFHRAALAACGAMAVAALDEVLDALRLLPAACDTANLAQINLVAFGARLVDLLYLEGESVAATLLCYAMLDRCGGLSEWRAILNAKLSDYATPCVALEKDLDIAQTTTSKLRLQIRQPRSASIIGSVRDTIVKHLARANVTLMERWDKSTLLLAFSEASHALGDLHAAIVSTKMCSRVCKELVSDLNQQNSWSIESIRDAGGDLRFQSLARMMECSVRLSRLHQDAGKHRKVETYLRQTAELAGNRFRFPKKSMQEWNAFVDWLAAQPCSTSQDLRLRRLLTFVKAYASPYAANCESLTHVRQALGTEDIVATKTGTNRDLEEIRAACECKLSGPV